MGRVLNWSSQRRDDEVARYLARREAELESQRMPDDAAADAARNRVPALDPSHDLPFGTKPASPEQSRGPLEKGCRM